MAVDDNAEESLRLVEEHLTKAIRDPLREELDSAPILDPWWFVVDTDGYTLLIGKVSGHPILRGPFIHTSPLLRLDRLHRWARTYSRFYRLGSRQLGPQEAPEEDDIANINSWADKVIESNLRLIRKEPGSFPPRA